MNNFINQLSAPKKNIDIALGINYYTSTKRKTQYFVGLLVKYMNFSYQATVTDSVYNPTIGVYFHTVTYKPAQDYQLATMVVNGIQVRITPTVNYKLFVGLGGWTPHKDLKTILDQNSSSSSSNTNTSNPAAYSPPFRLKVYLGMCFGYRF